MKTFRQKEATCKEYLQVRIAEETPAEDRTRYQWALLGWIIGPPTIDLQGSYEEEE